MSTIRGGATPICITYRSAPSKPVIKRTKKFVGWRNVAKNIIGAVADFAHSIAYEETETIEEVDGATAVHWAIEVDDPWGVNPEAGLVAVRVPERPPAGVHFEIFKVAPKQDPISAPRVGDEIPARPRARDDQNDVRARMRDALVKGGHFDPEAGMPDDV